MARIKQVFRRPGGNRLVILLHGYQDDPMALFTAVETLDPDGHFRFVVPRAPFETPGGPTWFAADPREAPQHRLTASLAELDLLIHEESESMGASPDDAIVIGYSQGGATALALALRAQAPARLMGVATIAGYLPATEGIDWDFDAAAGLTGALIVHGTGDDEVPVLQGRSAAKVLERNGIDCEFVEIDAGHTLDDALLMPVAAWLSAFA